MMDQITLAEWQEVRPRILARVQAKLHRRRIARRVVALVALLIWMATQQAGAQDAHTVYLPAIEKPALVDSVSCIECRRTWLPIIRASNVEGQADAATRFWGG